MHYDCKIVKVACTLILPDDRIMAVRTIHGPVSAVMGVRHGIWNATFIKPCQTISLTPMQFALNNLKTILGVNLEALDKTVQFEGETPLLDSYKRLQLIAIKINESFVCRTTEHTQIKAMTMEELDEWMVAPGFNVDADTRRGFAFMRTWGWEA